MFIKQCKSELCNAPTNPLINNIQRIETLTASSKIQM